MEILDAVYDIAVNNSDIWETANQLANEYLEKNNRDVKTASAEMVNFVQTNCTGTEFLNHIGKQMSIDAVIPAYEAGNLCVFMGGVIGVWNGLMEVAVDRGLMEKISYYMSPLIHLAQTILIALSGLDYNVISPVIR